MIAEFGLGYCHKGSMVSPVVTNLKVKRRSLRKSLIVNLLQKPRMGGDSNPRYLAVNTLSRRARSTTLPPIQGFTPRVRRARNTTGKPTPRKCDVPGFPALFLPIASAMDVRARLARDGSGQTRDLVAVRRGLICFVDAIFKLARLGEQRAHLFLHGGVPLGELGFLRLEFRGVGLLEFGKIAAPILQLRPLIAERFVSLVITILVQQRDFQSLLILRRLRRCPASSTPAASCTSAPVADCLPVDLHLVTARLQIAHREFFEAVPMPGFRQGITFRRIRRQHPGQRIREMRAADAFRRLRRRSLFRGARCR